MGLAGTSGIDAPSALEGDGYTRAGSLIQRTSGLCPERLPTWLGIPAFASSSRRPPEDNVDSGIRTVCRGGVLRLDMPEATEAASDSCRLASCSHRIAN